jgi:hypothetical protein
MRQSKKCTVIKSLLFLALMRIGALAYAEQAVGAVTHLSGPLLVTKADGSNKVLATHSAIEPGDTLATQKNGYAQISFSDDSRIVLQPGTVLTIDRFSYDPGKPEADHAAFTLVRGGIRTNAGLLGKRSKDRVTLTTPVATLAMEGASAIVQFQAPDAVAQTAQQAYLLASLAALDAPLTATRSDAPPVAAIRPMMLAQAALPPKTASRSPGLYVQVIDGLIHVTNPAGTQSFSAGQFGFTPSISQPPVVVPRNPGLVFSPPPAFSSTSPVTAGKTPAQSAAVDCVVR